MAALQLQDIAKVQYSLEKSVQDVTTAFHIISVLTTRLELQEQAEVYAKQQEAIRALQAQAQAEAQAQSQQAGPSQSQGQQSLQGQSQSSPPRPAGPSQSQVCGTSNRLAVPNYANYNQDQQMFGGQYNYGQGNQYNVPIGPQPQACGIPPPPPMPPYAYGAAPSRIPVPVQQPLQPLAYRPRSRIPRRVQPPARIYPGFLLPIKPPRPVCSRPRSRIPVPPPPPPRTRSKVKAIYCKRPIAPTYAPPTYYRQGQIPGGIPQIPLNGVFPPQNYNGGVPPQGGGCGN